MVWNRVLVVQHGFIAFALYRVAAKKLFLIRIVVGLPTTKRVAI